MSNQRQNTYAALALLHNISSHNTHNTLSLNTISHHTTMVLNNISFHKTHRVSYLTILVYFKHNISPSNIHTILLCSVSLSTQYGILLFYDTPYYAHSTYLHHTTVSPSTQYLTTNIHITLSTQSLTTQHPHHTISTQYFTLHCQHIRSPHKTHIYTGTIKSTS